MKIENFHLTMSEPRVEPWTTENYFDETGLHTRELFRTTIRLKRGTMGSFIDRFRNLASENTPFYLHFYGPAGHLIEAEVRAINLPDEQESIFDTIHPLIYLDENQQPLVFPNTEIEMMGY